MLASLLLSLALAQEAPVPAAPPAVDANTAAAFGDHLLGSGDPYNALTWYRLALFLDPARPDADGLRFRIGLAYERGERWSAAVFAYGQVTAVGADRAAYRAALADFQAGNTLSADVGLERLGIFYPDSALAPRAAYARGVLSLKAHDLKQAELRFAAFAFPDDALASRASALAAASREPLPRRLPALASALSLLPGLGQLYTGHPGDAAMAALFNIPVGLGAGLLLADGIDSGRGLEIGAGAVLSGVFLVTYPSNIIGAWRGAQRFNSRAAERRADTLLQQAWDRTLELDAADVDPSAD